MKKLKRFWRSLEEPYGIRGVRAHWRRYVGPELEAISPFLRSLKEPSLTYPCPRIGGDGCPRGVVVHGPEDIVAVCRTHPKECDTIKLSPADIVEYEFDWKRFCGFLSEWLGLVSVAEPVRGQRGIWHVGTWAVNAADHRPAFLVASASRALFDGAVGVLLISSQGPFIVLAPTLRFSGGAATQGLRQRGAALLALEDIVLHSGDGKLVAAGALPEVLSASASPDPAAAVGSQGNVYRREQDFWVLSFGGKTVRLKDSVGMSYLVELLRAPGKDVEAIQLVTTVQGGSPTAEVTPSIPMADQKAIQTVTQALEERKAELAAMDGAEDWVRRGKLTEEMAQLRSYLDQNEGFAGRSRKMGGTAERARQAVKNSISRAIEDIRAVHPVLADHLKASVQTGIRACYRPTVETFWQF